MSRKQSSKFVIDCSVPAKDQIFDSATMQDFEEFFNNNIKQDGKRKNLTGKVVVSAHSDKIEIEALRGSSLAKKYVKFLTKKFLSRNEMRSIFRVLASGKSTYQIRYMPSLQDEEE